MTSRHIPLPLLLLLLLPRLTHAGILGMPDGLYAAFDTSLGGFTCRLDHVEAPLTCANFVGLAEGSRPWIDVDTGLVFTNTPYFDGLIFHRVISNFVIQTGSRGRTLGTGGPGYQFPDEFSPVLRHDAFGTLSMANSGPDTNGGQIFITLGTPTHLDDRHSVFGRLTHGSNVVAGIGHVAVDGDDQPLTNVVLHAVDILRIGPDAQSFTSDHPDLPDIVPARSELAKGGASLLLEHDQRQNTEMYCTVSTNLTDWFLGDTIVRTAPSGRVSQAVTTLVGTAPDTVGFTMAEVRYPGFIAPPDLVGEHVNLDFGGLVIDLFLEAGGTGTFTGDFTNATTNLTYNLRRRTMRNLYLQPVLFADWLNPAAVDFNLHFTNATEGVVTGTAYPNFPSAEGNFGIAPGDFSILP